MKVKERVVALPGGNAVESGGIPLRVNASARPYFFFRARFSSAASGLTIDAIQSRNIVKRNPFFSIAPVINL